MKKTILRKICVVVTARPSYSRVKTLIQAIKEHKDLQLQLVVASSALIDRYGSTVLTIENDGFEIDAKVFNVLEGENLTAAAKTTGLGILELSTVFENLLPDMVVTVADRFETMATAVAASYMNIPLVHIQGGEVTGNIDEKVRHSISKLADYHFVATEQAKQRVIKLGENPDSVYNYGCPSIDLVKQLEDRTIDFNPINKYGGVGINFNWSSHYLVVLQHPVTIEYSDARKQIEETLYAIKEMGIPTFWFWPNVDAGADGTSKGIRAFREKYPSEKIHFFKSFEPDDFLLLIKNADCLIGNSSVGIRECAYLGVPVVNIGTRQHGRERGNNIIDVDYDKDEIVRAVKAWKNKSRPVSSMIYGGGNAGEKIASNLATLPLRFHKTITY